jgi:hypothetical protein
MKPIGAVALAVLAVVTPVAVHASEIGHYSPGLMSIRDFVIPPPGYFGVIYSYAYASDQLNDREGHKIGQVTIGRGPLSTTVDVDVDLDVYVVVPAFMWSSNWKVLGARYAAYASVPLSNTSIAASLATATGTGRSTEESNVGMADVFVQPLWLGWTKAHLDAALGYGFYAPVGRYDTETVTLPHIGDITAEATDNIGLGFWTHQLQGAGSWYPWADKRMAVVGALTWEIHGKKKDFDLTPGQNLALNWGVSEYLPLRKDQSLLLELGPAGYDSWQVTDDSGNAAQSAAVHDNVHGVGAQIGTIYTPWNVVLNFRYMYEYTATDRFQGQSFGLNLGIAL